MKNRLPAEEIISLPQKRIRSLKSGHCDMPEHQRLDAVDRAENAIRDAEKEIADRGQ